MQLRKRFGGRRLTNIIIMMASEGLLDSSDLLNYTGVFSSVVLSLARHKEIKNRKRA